MKPKFGKVFLVGAGPGDVGLITLKGFQLLQSAEIIFYDNLVNPHLLNFAWSNSEKIYVGKRGEGSSTDQGLIEDQLVAAAKQGKRVVRLKGGDPFIFGRGGEECERLQQENIDYEVVPGVSSAIAVPAYAGIPLTHRDFTSSVAFVTGHLQKESDLDWGALAKIGTLVFLMGVKNIRANMQNLLDAGLSQKTPAALIRWGSYSKQQTFLSTVGEISQIVESQKIMPPAILVVGEVANLHESLAWFEKKPLFGKKILITRASAENSALSYPLENLGAEVLEVPSLEIIPPVSWEKLDEAISTISHYDWLIFTSVHGIKFFFERFTALKQDIRQLASCSIAAVGPESARFLEKYCLKADKIPAEFNSQKLAESFSKKELSGKKVLIPHAEEGEKEWLDLLTQKGAQLDVVTAYRTKIPEESKVKIENLKNEKEIDLLTFASSSAVKNFVQLLPPQKQTLFFQIPALCIGPATLKTAQDLGFQTLLQSDEATLSSMIEKVREYFA